MCNKRSSQVLSLRILRKSEATNLNMLLDIPLQVTVELGEQNVL